MIKTKKLIYQKIFVLFVILITIGSAVLFYFSDNRKPASGIAVDNTTPTILQSPTPFPFQELTIPFLSQRNYDSTLKPLNKIDENSNYTSYLTSYSSDGVNVNGLLTIPQGQRPEKGWPGIVFVHGYIPPKEYKTTEKYGAYIDYLAKNGFVVYKIDLRGHGNSEGQPGGGYYSSDYVVDTLNAYSALQKAEFIDETKIGLWGHSMAGNIAFRSMVVKKDIPAVVIWAGAVYTYSDMSEYRISDKSYQPPDQESPSQQYRRRLRQQYGDFNPSSDFWKLIIPTNYTDGVQSSVQVHHAIDDAVVNIGYSRNLMKVLDTTTISHELYEYTSGGHNINDTSFNTAMQRTVDFYKNVFEDY